MGNYVSAPVAHADAGSLMPPVAAAAAAAEPTPTKVRGRESLGMPADASETPLIVCIAEPSPKLSAPALGVLRGDMRLWALGRSEWRRHVGCGRRTRQVAVTAVMQNVDRGFGWLVADRCDRRGIEGPGPSSGLAESSTSTCSLYLLAPRLASSLSLASASLRGHLLGRGCRRSTTWSCRARSSMRSCNGRL